MMELSVVTLLLSTLFVGGTGWPWLTESPSCRWNCGQYLGSCSCSSSCQYDGNCCHDYYSYCLYTTEIPAVSSSPGCGGRLYHSGSLSSPHYPYSYYNSAYCVWQLSVPQGQRIALSFVDLQLENCCTCDYVNVYDGPSTSSPLLAEFCYSSSLQEIHSSSSHMTVLFRTDGSAISHGFKAFFSSYLSDDKARVDCSSEKMTIAIRRSYLDSVGIDWQNLYVDDRHCRPTADSYEVFFSFPFNMCGTSKENNNGHVVYNNHVREGWFQSDEVTRQTELLNVQCDMEPNTTVGNVYKIKDVLNSTITGMGHFNTSMAFYNSSSFSVPINESQYEIHLNQDLYVQVQLNTPDDNLDLFLDTCIASPNQTFQARTYKLIQNGCRMDSTVYIYTNGQHYYAQFHFQAFKFLRTHSSVFLQCRVIICNDNDYNSRCRQGCRTRNKRSLNSNHHTDTVILGPITLKG